MSRKAVFLWCCVGALFGYLIAPSDRDPTDSLQVVLGVGVGLLCHWLSNRPPRGRHDRPLDPHE